MKAPPTAAPSSCHHTARPVSARHHGPNRPARQRPGSAPAAPYPRAPAAHSGRPHLGRARYARHRRPGPHDHRHNAPDIPAARCRLPGPSRSGRTGCSGRPGSPDLRDAAMSSALAPRLSGSASTRTPIQENADAPDRTGRGAERGIQRAAPRPSPTTTRRRRTRTGVRSLLRPAPRTRRSPARGGRRTVAGRSGEGSSVTEEPTPHAPVVAVRPAARGPGPTTSWTTENDQGPPKRALIVDFVGADRPIWSVAPCSRAGDPQESVV